MMVAELSVIIPTLNAASALPATLKALSDAAEVIVVDGGSSDATLDIVAAAGVRLLTATRGRGSQLASGIKAATQPWLLLLHADTLLSPEWPKALDRFQADWSSSPESGLAHCFREQLYQPDYSSQADVALDCSPDHAGYFRFALDSDDPRARRLERMVAWRCRTLGLPYGDQGLLIHRDLLRKVGGMRPLPLMEDVDLIRRLGRARLSLLGADAVTSAQKWESEGYLRRSARNLVCLSLWFAGVPPRLILRLYG